MIDSCEFRRYAHEFVDWMADYLETVDQYPVKSSVKPGEVFDKIPDAPPAKGESMDDVFRDFREVILPGMTHWQSPGFFAYFTANSSYPSVLGEMLTSVMAAQCMVWETSPAATELEEKVMNWLRDMIGLPGEFKGVIQDTASTATLVALLTAREKAMDYQINERGHQHQRFRVYCSTEAHSSIEKAVKIAGLGRINLVKIPVDASLAIIPEKLEEAIRLDGQAGFIPLFVVAAIGTTGTLAMDPLDSLGRICHKEKIWLHVDAAFAGTAQVLPEYRRMIEGIRQVDSYVFNPHKWMFTNFDCSAYFIKDTEALIRTFEILPEYLKTGTRGSVNEYRDWGIQLGRRFRALKLWFVIRDYGVEGIQAKVRQHIQWAKELAEMIDLSPAFDLHRPQHLNVVCFRYHPEESRPKEDLNDMNRKLMERLNKSGKIYLTHTSVRDLVTLRIVVAQTYVARKHVIRAWELIQVTASKINGR